MYVLILSLNVDRVCVWTAIFLFLLAIFNAGNIISRFTRIADELFGMLIVVLFIQEAIKVCPREQDTLFNLLFSIKVLMLSRSYQSQGLVGEFNVPVGEDSSKEKYQFTWLYTNGLLAIIFSFGLLFTSIQSRTARSWRYGTGTPDSRN